MKLLQRSPARRQAGTTLIESLIGLAVVSTVLGTALPAFEQARVQRQLDGAAAQLETDLQHARSLAAARDRSVRIGFFADTAGSCYVVHTGSADSCSCADDGSAVCTGGAVALRSERFPAGETVQLSSNVRSILFDAARGTSTPTGTLRLVARNDAEVRLVVNIMGRVRSCTPNGVPGHKACCPLNQGVRR